MTYRAAATREASHVAAVNMCRVALVTESTTSTTESATFGTQSTQYAIESTALITEPAAFVIRPTRNAIESTGFTIYWIAVMSKPEPSDTSRSKDTACTPGVILSPPASVPRVATS